MNIADDNTNSLLRQEEADKSFTDIYNQYSGQIFANVLKLVKDPQVAEEIVQDVFTTLWQKWTVIRLEKSLLAYLYRMSANKVIDFFRTMQTNRAMKAHFTALAIEHYSHIEEALQYRESEQLLHKAIASLAPQQQRVYQLCRTEGLSYKEAADLLGISQHTVKEYLVKANQLIRNYLISNIDKSIPLLVWVMMKK
jgi:RNA polymerase sigma-70 factor (ECF subfamily)